MVMQKMSSLFRTIVFHSPPDPDLVVVRVHTCRLSDLVLLVQFEHRSGMLILGSKGAMSTSACSVMVLHTILMKGDDPGTSPSTCIIPFVAVSQCSILPF
ncbi:hypothetical protein PGQ11_007868 [Apiospora arundinis]|uniref:Uncharacterized protein n=1 Tax=Apiospora arundinis TaxID=335852 RepID=A0ABR2IWX2_9PEZI